MDDNKRQIVNNLIYLDDYRPWINTYMECPCGKNWVATHLQSCTHLQCPSCLEMVSLTDEKE